MFDFGFGGSGLFRFLFRSFRLFRWFRSGCSGGFVPVVPGFSTCLKIEVSVCQIFPRTQEIPYAARLCSDFCLIYCRLLLPIRNVLAQSHS